MPPGYGIHGESLDLGSSFSVTFTLQEATDYTLSGSVDYEGGFVSFSHAHVRLIGPGSVVIHEAEVESDPGCIEPECSVGGDAIDVAGTLAAGTYTLEAQSIGTATDFFSTSLGGPVGTATGGSYDVAFALPQRVPATSGAGRAFLGLLLVGLAALRVARGPR